MGYIKQLSEDLIKKIAAGEVIERPASVVKELIENSIDAGATKIEIEVERSGKYIKVSDNGMGIDPEDVPLLFARHATSKIKRFDDLWNVQSLGFRGEALASISAVSKITCRSKHINQEYGFEIKLADGDLNKKSSAICIGTVFEIDDLFYNVPARQKFLKSELTEFGQINDVVISSALSRSKILFALSNNKNITLKTSGSRSQEQVIIEVLGNDLVNKLVQISGGNNILTLSGYISALEIFRSDRKSQFIFVNNRPVKCQIISKAISSAFEGLLPQGKYPIVVLHLNFKPSFVDVNVHPGKKEVRYTHPNDVYNIVLHSIQNSIAEYYKSKYKEKSVYSLPETVHEKTDLPQSISSTSSNISSYTKAAIEFYDREEMKQEDGREAINCVSTTSSTIFSINSLKCQVCYSNKPIANMTRIANKTIFEVGTIFDNNIQIVFSGEIIGEQDHQKNLFNMLSDLSGQIYKTFLNSDNAIQKKIISPLLEDESLPTKKNRKKPPDELLYAVWDRDNWTCVYCAKKLLDPKVVKDAMLDAEDAFVTYINSLGEKVTNHVLREYLASYDHYLPVSKLPQFSFDLENLFACCIECNRKKLDSMELKAWKPIIKNSWHKPLEVAGLCFNTSKTIQKLLI